MDPYFIVLYKGSDNNSRFRLLTKSGIDEEKETKESSFFRKENIYLSHGLECFHVYFPIIAPFEELEFNPNWEVLLLAVADGSPAYGFFANMSNEYAISLYNRHLSGVVNLAMCQKQECSVH